MAIEFDRYAREGNEFIKELSQALGHPDDQAQAGILLRSTLHILRDRITIGESLHLLAQLPMFLKALYVEQWEYLEEPIKTSSLEEFTEAVKGEQATFGERQFNWPEPTADLVRTVFNSLGKYWTEGEIEDVVAQLPPSLKPLFEIKIRG
jgi:uncharacterized protein (DUF2267 family)